MTRSGRSASSSARSVSASPYEPITSMPASSSTRTRPSRSSTESSATATVVMRQSYSRAGALEFQSGGAFAPPPRIPWWSRYGAARLLDRRDGTLRALELRAEALSRLRRDASAAAGPGPRIPWSRYGAARLLDRRGPPPRLSRQARGYRRRSAHGADDLDRAAEAAHPLLQPREPVAGNDRSSPGAVIRHR